jgi:hypothetical protein
VSEDSQRKGDELREAVSRPVSFVQTAKAIAWAFFGVRRGADYEKDVAKLNPVHVFVAGVIGAVIFVLCLVALVNWVTSGSAGAQ